MQTRIDSLESIEVPLTVQQQIQLANIQGTILTAQGGLVRPDDDVSLELVLRPEEVAGLIASSQGNQVGVPPAQAGTTVSVQQQQQNLPNLNAAALPATTGLIQQGVPLNAELIQLASQSDDISLERVQPTADNPSGLVIEQDNLSLEDIVERNLAAAAVQQVGLQATNGLIRQPSANLPVQVQLAGQPTVPLNADLIQLASQSDDISLERVQPTANNPSGLVIEQDNVSLEDVIERNLAATGQLNRDVSLELVQQPGNPSGPLVAVEDVSLEDIDTLRAGQRIETVIGGRRVVIIRRPLAPGSPFDILQVVNRSDEVDDDDSLELVARVQRQHPASAGIHNQWMMDASHEDISLEDRMALLSPADRRNRTVIEHVIRTAIRQKQLEELHSNERDNISLELLGGMAGIARTVHHQMGQPGIRRHSDEDFSIELRHIQGQQRTVPTLSGAIQPIANGPVLQWERSNERDDFSLEFRDRSNGRLDLATLHRIVNNQQPGQQFQQQPAVAPTADRVGRRQETAAGVRSADRSRILNPIVGNLRSSNRFQIDGRGNDALAFTSGGNPAAGPTFIIPLLVAYLLKTIV